MLDCNLDETSVTLYQEPRRGMLTPGAKRKAARSAIGFHRKCPKASTRSAFTHVAILCSDAEVQKKIPQILLVRDSLCSQVKYEEIKSQLPDHVKIWRTKNGWMNVDTFVKVLDELSKSLASLKDTHQIVLSCDAYKAHLHQRCWRSAARHNILMFTIPAKITYALQPLDVYVFAQYKRKLRQTAQEQAIRARSSGVTLEGTILATSSTVTELLHGRSWAHAFSRLGLHGRQNDVSRNLLKHIAVEETPVVGAGFPELKDLVNCWPSRLEPPIGCVFSAVAKVVQGLPSTEADVVEPKAPSPAAPMLWVGRTRSTSHMALPAPDDLPPVPPPPFPPPVHGAAVPRLHRLPSRPMMPSDTPPPAV